MSRNADRKSPKKRLHSKRHEEVLHLSAEWIRRIIDNSEEGIAIHAPDGTIKYVNQRMSDMLGYAREEILGRTTLDFVDDKEKEAVIRARESLRAQGRFSKERELRRKDGSVLWTIVNASLQRDRVGNPIGYLAMHTDITERKRAEAELEESRERFSHAVAAAREGVWDWNMETNDVWYSPRYKEMLGYSENEIEHHISAWLRLMHPDDKERSLKVVDAVRRGEREYEIEFRMRHKDGHYLDILSRGFPIRGKPDGKILRIIGTHFDLTERKRAEDALKHLNEQLEERVTERTAALAKSARKIQAERERFNEILGQMPVYVVLLSLDYHVPFANRFFEERFGKSNGKRCFEYLFHRVEPCENCETFKVLKTNAPHRWEWLGPDNRNYDIYDFPFTDADGSHLIMEVGLDITERKKAAAELVAEQQRFFGVLETLPALIWLLTPDYNIAFANRAVCEKFGDVKGRPCYEAYFGQKSPCEFCETYKVLRTNQPMRWEAHPPDGSVIDVCGFPFTDVDGSPMILEMGIDITEQRRAETALREVSAYNRTLIEASMDPLATIGLDGRITDVNVATENATGYSRRELLGADFSEYFSEPEKARAGYQQVFREGMVRDYPLEIRHRYGHTTPVLYNATVYRNAEGQVIGVFAAARDITERQQAEQELRQAHRDLEMRASQLRALAGQLTLTEQRERSRLAKILHDHLQQLLVAAKFRVAVIGRGSNELIQQAAKEVEDLIDESIAASRSLTAELSPPIIYEAGLHEGLQWLARRMTEKQRLLVELDLQEDGDLPQDIRVLLFESVRELLFNAVKHAQTQSAAVRVRRIGDLLQVTVSDQGVGFNPAEISPAGKEGRGFGLFNIRERLEFMGGTLEIISNPGQGSRFVLSVPVAAPAANETKIYATSQSPKTHLARLKGFDAGRKIRVMLSDDHAIVRQGIANLLKDEPDMEIVGHAADGHEAVALAAKLQPDVILMDVSMPTLNGIEATRLILNLFPRVRIIGLSMFEDAERAQAMHDAGAIAYLSKSGPAEALVAAIRKKHSSDN